MLTSEKSIKKVKKTTQRLLKTAKGTVNKEDVLAEVKSINKKLQEMHSMYGDLGLESISKVFKEVTMDMILAMAEFNVVSVIHDEFMKEFFIHKES